VPDLLIAVWQLCLWEREPPVGTQCPEDAEGQAVHRW